MVTALVDWRGIGEVAFGTKWTFEAPEGALKDPKTAKVVRVLIKNTGGRKSWCYDNRQPTGHRWAAEPLPLQFLAEWWAGEP